MESDLKQAAEKVKKELSTKLCGKCHQKIEAVRVTCGCFKVYYCSDKCKTSDETHEKLCRIVQRMHVRPGYRPAFDGSRFALSVLYEFGATFLKKYAGAIGFSKHPQYKQEALEHKLKHGKSTARIIRDPVGKCIYHFFILPISALEPTGKEDEFFDSEFIQLCKKARLIREGVVPLVHMRLDLNGEEVEGLTYYMILPCEVDGAGSPSKK